LKKKKEQTGIKNQTKTDDNSSPKEVLKVHLLELKEN